MQLEQLNSLIVLQPESKLNLRGYIQLPQLHVTGNGDVQLRFERTLPKADLDNPLSNGSSRRLGLSSGSGPLELCRKLSTRNFVSKVVLDEVFKEEFEDSDTPISVGFQSARDAQEECRGKNIATIGAHGGEGPFVSGRRKDDLMSGTIFEVTGVTLVFDRAVIGSKTATASCEDGSGSDSNNTDAYFKKMLRADPGSPLLLTNYARFAKES